METLDYKPKVTAMLGKDLPESVRMGAADDDVGVG